MATMTILQWRCTSCHKKLHYSLPIQGKQVPVCGIWGPCGDSESELAGCQSCFIRKQFQKGTIKGSDSIFTKFSIREIFVQNPTSCFLTAHWIIGSVNFGKRDAPTKCVYNLSWRLSELRGASCVNIFSYSPYMSLYALLVRYTTRCYWKPLFFVFAIFWRHKWLPCSWWVLYKVK